MTYGAVTLSGGPFQVTFIKQHHTRLKAIHYISLAGFSLDYYGFDRLY